MKHFKNIYSTRIQLHSKGKTSALDSKQLFVSHAELMWVVGVCIIHESRQNTVFYISTRTKVPPACTAKIKLSSQESPQRTSESPAERKKRPCRGLCHKTWRHLKELRAGRINRDIWIPSKKHLADISIPSEMFWKLPNTSPPKGSNLDKFSVTKNFLD